MISPLITIYTVVYNDRKGVKKTIESVLDQSYKNIEYIIIDGGSKDGTLSVIKEYKDHIAYLISEKDDGIYDAMNKAIRKSSGVLIGLLNSGDVFHKNAVECIVNLYRSNGNSENFIYSGGMNKVNSDGDLLYSVTLNEENILNKYYTMPINHTSTFVPRNIFEKIGLYKDDLRITADYEFILRALQANIEIKYTDDILADMLVGGISGNHIFLPSRLKEEYLLRYKYCGRLRAIVILLRIVFFALLKVCIPDKLLYFFYRVR